MEDTSLAIVTKVCLLEKFILLWAEGKKDLLAANERPEMFEHVLIISSREVSANGLPFTAKYPEGCTADINGVKAYKTYAAPWSAEWKQEDVANQVVLGRPFSADSTSFTLHEGQEACKIVRAPFEEGNFRNATIFTQIMKIGFTSVTLALREAVTPYQQLSLVSSPSPGLQDPQSHRFSLETFGSLKRGSSYALCVGLAGLLPSPATGLQSPAELVLPLRKRRTLLFGHDTFILQVKDGKEAASGTATIDPFPGYTWALDVEITQGDFNDANQPQRRYQTWALRFEKSQPLAVGGSVLAVGVLLTAAGFMARRRRFERPEHEELPLTPLCQEL